MRRKFVAKGAKKRIGLKILGILLVVGLSLTVTFNLLLSLKKHEKIDNLKLAEKLFTYGTNNNSLFNINLLNPKELLHLGLNYVLEIKEPTFDEVELLNRHINSDEPVVYIYNSHDTETYDSSLAENYNILYSVKIASYILSDYLADLGITSYVETESIGDYLKANNLSYKDSYQGSRHFLEERLAKYPSIELIIDLHRDSALRNVTTSNIDGKSYAKIMFVVGLDYETYEPNLQLAERLNAKIDASLSRGISKKTGSKVNGIYNQDVKDGALLVELGGVDNTIEEVANTLKLLANAIFEERNKEDGKEEEN